MESNYVIDLQQVCSEPLCLSTEQIKSLANRVLSVHCDRAEITLRFVDLVEIHTLNLNYRDMDKPTNVLAFPSQVPAEIILEKPFLGDVIICPEVLKNESTELKKSLESHWYLILIHGILHLLGYDHIKDEDTAIMQSLEIKLLAEYGFNNPYDTEEH